jgi:acetylornithine deacetylase/succinyl-diaminopimelate desuccinylase-like protein
MTTTLKECAINVEQVTKFVNNKWDDEIIPKISEYIEIPNQSPLFDKDYGTNGYQEQVVDLMMDWANKQGVKNLDLRVERAEGKTPLIFGVVEGEGKTQETILMYGHFDKQPPMTEFWEEGLHPHKPVIRDGKLYGRGGADDGYAIFASITAVKAIQEQNIPTARIVIMIEGSEESGSHDLPYYVKKLEKEIATPSLVVCLDSGCGNYEQMWLTTSLRGMVAGNLKVNILKEGVHSGAASGIVPSSFRILRLLLDRIENPQTGQMILDGVQVEIPEDQQKYIEDTAKALGSIIHEEFPFVEGAQPVSNDLVELVTNRTWRPTVSVTGVDGMPPLANAGNVLRTHTSVKLSIRLPPTLNPEVMVQEVKKAVENNVPYNAQVVFEQEKGATGWMAPPMSPWLLESCSNASQAFFNKPSCAFGEGGTIPLMGMLSRCFPSTQFIITGVLGPASNAHGPNEFLHIDMGKKLTMCVAKIIGDHYLNTKK